ncbi:InlB B-repeat-containing protein, partial [Candidatus Saccharibacteria bacterium]|nr:InlB B-repeat-containing protein [Candidatus Saccharibacteria bacterium]
NVNAATDKSSGIYKNELVFTAIANPIPVDYTLTFNKNTEDTVANLPDPLTATAMATSYGFTIPDTSGEGTLPEMTRDGYSFVGWSTSASTRQGSGSGPDGLYVAGDTYTVVADDSGNPDYTTHGTGSATLYAFWEEAFSCVANQICYNPNGADVVGTMENQTTVYMTSSTSSGTTDSTALSGSTTEFTLYSPNYSRTGYGFAGWNTKADGTGTMFGPNQTLTTSDSTLTSAMQSDLGSKGLIFHAIWVASAGDLQTWTGCGNLTQGSVTALTDSRDSQTYAVAKLADDKCWTIENMRYKPTVGTQTTSFSTSNITFYQQYSLTNIDRTKDPLAVSSQGSPYYQWYSYGGQYSWLSSINTTTNYGSQYYNYNTSSSSYTTTGTTMAARTATDAVKNANICPAGWRLPRVAYNGYVDANAGSNSDFPYLNNALNGSYSGTSTFAGSNNWRKYPNNFVFAGYWNGANANNRGTNGYYWSSSVYDSSLAYYLFFLSTGVTPVGNSNKRYGYSVRCVYSS